MLPPRSSAAGQTPDLDAMAGDDRAWVSIDTPLSRSELRGFLDDVERLFRINPLLELDRFEALGTQRFAIRGRNLSNGKDFDTELTVTASADGIAAAYATGLKASTAFRAEARVQGSRLVVTDSYDGVPAAERQARLDEVDKSLNAWGRALHDYLQRWSRWSRFPPWRWYMARIWQPLTPSARRIVFLILAISVFEVVTMALVLAVWLAVF